MSLVSFISQEKQSSAQFPLRCVVADESRFEPQAPTTSASAVLDAVLVCLPVPQQIGQHLQQLTFLLGSIYFRFFFSERA